MTFLFFMPISVTGLVSYFVQFSFFFNFSIIFRTIGLSMFAFFFLGMNMLISHFDGILVVWPSLICHCPLLFSLVLLVCSCIWILGFQLCSNWFGSSNPYMLLCTQMIIFYMFSWFSKSVSSLTYIRFIKCHVILFAFCLIHFGKASVYKSVRYGLKHVWLIVAVQHVSRTSGT